MAEITFIHPGGRRTTLRAAPGQSVMEVGAANGIDEIVAQCGGNAVCATCHVFVDEADFSRLSPVGALEDELLETTAEPRGPTSRLSCQVVIRDNTESLTIRLPERQL